MTFRFNVTFLEGVRRVARIEGKVDLTPDELTVADVNGVVLLEQQLEKLTGYRVHIEQVA